MEENSENIRNYGIDNFRVLAMFLVTMLHVISHGGISAATNSNIMSTKYFGVVLLEIIV